MRIPRIPPTRAASLALAGCLLMFPGSSSAQVRRNPTSGPIVEAPGSLKSGMFEHRFDAAEVTSLARRRGADRYPDGYKAMTNTPPFVLVTASFLDTAAKTYADRGIPLGTLFEPAERLPVIYRPKADYPMQFNHTDGRIVVNLSPIAWDLDLHRQRTAHELFHAIQGRTVGGFKSTSLNGLWWIESTAEYAACDVVWPNLSNRKGGGRGRAYPYLLDSPLTATGAPADDHDTKALAIDWSAGEELEYDKGYFIQYLVDHEGADFFAMNQAVLDLYGADNILGPRAVYRALDRFLTEKSANRSTLAEVYGRFAAHYLLGSGSPLASARIPRGSGVDDRVTPLVAVVKGLKGQEHEADRLAADAEGKPADPLEYRFLLRNGYTAKMWAVEADMLMDPSTGAPQSSREIRVIASELPEGGQMSARIFKASRGGWMAGEPRPLFTLTKTGDSGTLSLGAQETLYVVMTSTLDPSTGRRFANVRVLGIPLPPRRPTPTPTPTPTPRAASGPTAGKPGSGYWKLIDTRSLKYAPNPASGFINVRADVSDGSISGTMTDPGNGDGPATWAGACTWSVTASSGLDRLVPGDALDVSMTVNERSVPEKGSGWNHGHVGVQGSIRFDMPGLALGASHGAAADLVNLGATWQKDNPAPSVTQKASWKVPSGPGPSDWGGKAALDANCSFGRFERVYQWTTEPWVEKAPPPARPSPKVQTPSLTGTWRGTWTNGVGEQGADSLVIEERADGTLTGTWSGNVPVSGRRLDARTLELTGRTPTRAYEVTGELSGGVLTLRYVARRLDGTGSYRGTSSLER